MNAASILSSQPFGNAVVSSPYINFVATMASCMISFFRLLIAPFGQRIVSFCFPYDAFLILLLISGLGFVFSSRRPPRYRARLDLVSLIPSF